ncbi:hypothetical protein SAMN04488556_3413 [Halostagnicola kamekurae]|uniref:Uncharacterized protein n=1 Tax=Halostagnicola kamekurae TaxID=619731 RepID=A0A1I6TTG1_9EURY|nr:hypothetical protein SAMN04488556_3413 [Halostagnicola kamekurae]
MSYELLTPQVNLSSDIVDTFNDYSSDPLQDVARCVEALAERKEREARLEDCDFAGGFRRFSRGHTPSSMCKLESDPIGT